jgi:carboxymethylenebutenolidase
MCFEFDSLPPELPAELRLTPVAGGAPGEVTELTSADGTRFSAYFAGSREASEGAAAVVIFPDVRGLYRFYEELAERFAQAGHHAIAIDYFGRTAGTGERGEDFEYRSHVPQTTVEQVQQDAAAAAAELEARTGDRPVVTVGFCFGGFHSFLAATNPDLGLAGVVGFYGILEGSRFGAASPKDVAAQMRCPVLGLFGGADQAVPPEHIAEFEAGLEAAGVEHEIVTYPGAPHSFFDRKYDQYAEECEDAWRRTLAFVGARSAVV